MWWFARRPGRIARLNELAELDWYGIEVHKEKGQRLQARDRGFTTVAKQLSRGRITHEEYVRKIQRANTKTKFPKTEKAILKLLESDSE